MYRRVSGVGCVFAFACGPLMCAFSVLLLFSLCSYVCALCNMHGSSNHTRDGCLVVDERVAQLHDKQNF